MFSHTPSHYYVWKGEINIEQEKNGRDSVLLSLKEVCTYLGVGETKARELVRGHNGFGVQIGNRWYANKKKLDEWISNMSI